MQTRFFRKTSGLFAVMLAAAATAQADDKPAAAKKPTAVNLELVAQVAADKTPGKKPAVHSLAISPADKVLASDVLWVYGAAETRKLGVAVTPADPVLRANVPATKGKLGLVVTSVVKDSPAAQARIHTGDILLKLATKELATVSDLTVAVQNAKSPADVALIRSGKPVRVSVRLAASKNASRSAAGTYELILKTAGGSKFTIGVDTHPVDATLSSQLVLPPSTGLIVTSVAKDSAAAKAGLQKHDVILTVADEYVGRRSHLGKALDKADGKPVKLEFLRAGRKQSCMVTATKRKHEQPVRFWQFHSYTRHTVPHLSRNGIFTVHGWRSKDERSDLNAQVDRLSRQVDDLKNTLDALKKQLAARKTKVKTTKSK